MKTSPVRRPRARLGAPDFGAGPCASDGLVGAELSRGSSTEKEVRRSAWRFGTGRPPAPWPASLGASGPGPFHSGSSRLMPEPPSEMLHHEIELPRRVTHTPRNARMPRDVEEAQPSVGSSTQRMQRLACASAASAAFPVDDWARRERCAEYRFSRRAPRALPPHRSLRRPCRAGASARARPVPSPAMQGAHRASHASPRCKAT